MKCLIGAIALLTSLAVSQAGLVVMPWIPMFQGVDQAVGTNFPSTTFTNNGVVLTDSTLQVAHCVRVDLTDPGVRLFTTPPAPNPIPNSRETLSLIISNFIRSYGVQVAADANYYSVNPGGSDPTSEGLPSDNEGLLVSMGQVVSAPDGGRFASLLFGTNNAPWLNLLDRPPVTNASGIYTAVTGYYPVLTNGVNVWALYYNDFYNLYSPGDTFIHAAQPRTVYGVSQDKRYLFLMTIDGRQGGYSDGALDVEMAMWMLRFGAWDALNMDGGGSTAMYTTDSAGNPVPLNHSSYVGSGRERILGNHFGVYARPLLSFIDNVAAEPADTFATITWTTPTNATSQIEYGLTPSYGTLSAYDPTPVTNHSVTLTGLAPATQYFYRILSSDGTTQFTWASPGPFQTTNDLIIGVIFDLTNDWKFNTASLDGVNWQAPGYDDSGWTNHGPGVLWADAANTNGNSAIQFLPLDTHMPLNPATGTPGSPFVTYYFRTHFTYTNNLPGVTLTFSNYIDDGAAFYLNGVEINRAFLPVPAFSTNLALNYNCHPSGNATCPYVFDVSGDLATNLHTGDNVLAAEVHNYSTGSPDITFGQALSFTVPPAPAWLITNLVIIPGETTAVLTWTTLVGASSQVQFGLTPELDNATPLDNTLVTNHSVTLTGLSPLTPYNVRVNSSIGAANFTADDVFSTVPFYAELASLTNGWTYTTNNLDGVNWPAPDYEDSGWLGQGPALLFLETNPDVYPRNTPVPPTPDGYPWPTYYFRTHFPLNTNLAGFALLFTNYIDDGAILYLNGTEIQRIRMSAAPQTVSYADLAEGCPPVNCDAVASAPDLFRISGDLLTNLVAGDNVLAAEVHQRAPTSSDIVFGSAVGMVRALASETKLRMDRSGKAATISWDGLGFTLQQTRDLTDVNSWTDVAGPVKKSPYAVTNPPAMMFYRLRE